MSDSSNNNNRPAFADEGNLWNSLLKHRTFAGYFSLEGEDKKEYRILYGRRIIR